MKYQLSSYIPELYQDHRNFRNLLDVLKRQVLRVGGSEDPDYGLMEDVVDYMNHYSESAHRRVEEGAFDALAAHESGIGAVMKKAARLHSDAVRDGNQLVKDIEGIRSGAIMGISSFQSLARRYIDSYQRCMSLEERYLLPRAADVLGTDDWLQIDRSLAGAGDSPLEKSAVRNYRGAGLAIAGHIGCDCKMDRSQ